MNKRVSICACKDAEVAGIDGGFYPPFNGLREQANSYKASRAGFTLLELLLVLLIFSFTITLAVSSSTGGLRKARLKTTAKKISKTLNYARNLAISEKRVYYAHALEDKFVISAVEAENLKMEILLPDQLKITAPQEDTVFFYPRGNSSGGLFEVTSIRNESIYSVKIEPATGRVRLTVL